MPRALKKVTHANATCQKNLSSIVHLYNFCTGTEGSSPKDSRTEVRDVFLLYPTPSILVREEKF